MSCHLSGTQKEEKVYCMTRVKEKKLVKRVSMFGVQGRGVKRGVSYVWRSRKGRVKEQQLDISHMFGVQGRECIYYKTRHMHFVLTHTLQNEGNGFKDTSNS